MAEPVGLFDESFKKLERAMEIATKRQAVISHNLANAHTPGYVALDFDEKLMQDVERGDQNKGVVEEELAKLTDNSMRYSTYVKLLSSKLNILRTVATQGRR